MRAYDQNESIVEEAESVVRAEAGRVTACLSVVRDEIIDTLVARDLSSVIAAGVVYVTFDTPPGCGADITCSFSPDVLLDDVTAVIDARAAQPVQHRSSGQRQLLAFANEWNVVHRWPTATVHCDTRSNRVSLGACTSFVLPWTADGPSALAREVVDIFLVTTHSLFRAAREAGL